MTTIYRHLAADEQRARQVIADVLAALSKNRNCPLAEQRYDDYLKQEDIR